MSSHKNKNNKTKAPPITKSNTPKKRKITKEEKTTQDKNQVILQEYDINKTHRWMEPGPVVMVVTSYNSKPNVMTIGFHMCIQHEPPLLGIILGPWDHSFKALQKNW